MEFQRNWEKISEIPKIIGNMDPLSWDCTILGVYKNLWEKSQGAKCSAEHIDFFFTSFTSFTSSDQGGGGERKRRKKGGEGEGEKGKERERERKGEEERKGGGEGEKRMIWEEKKY